MEPTALRLDPALGFLEELAKHSTRSAVRRQPDAVRVHGDGSASIAELHGRIPRLRRGHPSHELIDRDGVAIRWSELAAGQPDIATIMLSPESTRMVKPADGRDVCAVLLQWLENFREGVILPGFENLKVERVHPVGEIDEDTAPGGRFAGGRGSPRPHAVEKGKGEGGTSDPLEYGTTIKLDGISQISDMGHDQMTRNGSRYPYCCTAAAGLRHGDDPAKNSPYPIKYWTISRIR